MIDSVVVIVEDVLVTVEVFVVRVIDVRVVEKVDAVVVNVLIDKVVELTVLVLVNVVGVELTVELLSLVEEIEVELVFV